MERDSKMNCSLNDKVDKILAHAAPDGWSPTGCDRELYATLSEPIVRQAVAWQDEAGRIIDPYEPGDTTGFASFTAARFVGALGFLIEAGRCHDLRGTCARSLDVACDDLAHAHERPIRGAEFYPKELMRGYLALRDGFDKNSVRRWKDLLGGYDPEQNYSNVLSKVKPEENYDCPVFDKNILLSRAKRKTNQ